MVVVYSAPLFSFQFRPLGQRHGEFPHTPAHPSPLRHLVSLRREFVGKTKGSIKCVREEGALPIPLCNQTNDKTGYTTKINVFDTAQNVGFRAPSKHTSRVVGFGCGGGGRAEELRFASSRPAFPHLTLSHPFGV